MNQRWLIVSTLLLIPFVSLAEEDIEAIGDEELKSYMQKSIGLLAAFTSQNALSTGVYEVDPVEDDPGFEFKVGRIPFRYKFTGGEGYKPYLETHLGFYSAKEEILLGETADDSETTSVALALGGGVQIKLPRNFHIAPGMNLAYAKIKNSYTYNDDYSLNNVKPELDGKVFNTSVDTLSLIPYVRGGYSYAWDYMEFFWESKLAYIYTKTILTDYDVQDVSAESGFFRNAIGLVFPTDWKLMGKKVGIGGFTGRTDFSGDLIGEYTQDYMWLAGLYADIERSGEQKTVSRLGIKLAYNFNERLQGWSLGFRIIY